MNNHPAHSYAAVTPSDTVDLLPTPCRSLFIGTGGNVSVYPKGAFAAVVFKNVASGVTLPIGASRVLATGTTATDIVALY